jgi:hypothetical protein
MLRFRSVEGLIRSARWLGLGALLAALPLSVTAASVTEDFSVSLDGLPGTIQFTYDPLPADELHDADGYYVDAGNGLDSFQLTYNSVTYSLTTPPGQILLSPTVFLPGNSTIPAGDTYAFLAVWLISGSIADGNATIIGVGRDPGAFMATDVSAFDVFGSGSTLLYGIDGNVTAGTITPEPVLFPVTALGLAGLWFARRRKAII